MIPDFDKAAALQSLIDSGLPAEQAALLVEDFLLGVEPVHAAMTAMLADALTEEMRAAALSIITADTPQETIDSLLAMAQDKARIQAGTLATNLSTAELNKIGSVIADGIANGQTAAGIQSKLTMVTELDSNRAAQLDNYAKELAKTGTPQAEIDKLVQKAHDSLVIERRFDIVQNEAHIAMSATNDIHARALGQKYKFWISSSDGRVCDVCAANEAQGPIPINQSFQSGHSEPPAHPGHCHCTLGYSSGDDLESDKQLSADLAAATAAAREEEAA